MSMDRCYDIGEQVLFDILLYLPVMSLLQFKAVCKDWFSLIESPTFISEHLKHNRDSNKDNFIILNPDNGQSSDNQKIALLSGSQYEECDYDIDNWQFWHPANDVGVWMIGYCDGIVCLSHEDEIALWNPALKQLRHLPQPLFYDRLQECRPFSIAASFGIDVKRNDYKLVRILWRYSNTGSMIGNQVEVYNLGGDNSWRTIYIDDVLPFNDIITFYAISSGKNGKCFWIASLADYTPILLSFDFNDDVFSTMLLPRFSVSHFDLDLLDEKVVYIDSDEDDRIIEIWMLHEFGVENSWNLIYKVGPLSYLDFFIPRRISKNGEFLLCSKLDTELGEYMFYLYNLHTQQGKYCHNRNLHVNRGQLIRYDSSLFSLKSTKNVRPIK